MPPRYPQSNFGRVGTTQDFQVNNNNNNFIYSPKTTGIPRGGTGATDDSFASSFKTGKHLQAYPAGYVNPNFSQMALTANSFH